MNEYDSYVGKKVSVALTTVTRKIGNKDHEFNEYSLKDDDTIIKEIKDKAEKSGLIVRIWFPNSLGTCDFRLNRLNIYIDGNENALEITGIKLG